MGKELVDVNIRVSLEDSNGGIVCKVASATTNLGELSQRDARLFAIGSDEVLYKETKFLKITDDTSLYEPEGIPCRYLFYHKDYAWKAPPTIK